jgi:DNA polymerase III subunit gamma/tau
VSKDPQTITLLEVSQSLRTRYATQAAQCEQGFLLRGLSMISKTDVSYKSARNQRLLVEMTLMQLCFIGGQDAEKKNDEVNPFARPVQAPAAPPVQAKPVVAPLAEEPVKIASKPSVPFEKLKIRSAFSLQDSGARQGATQAVAVAEVAEKPVQQFNKDYSLQQIAECIASYADQKLRAGAKQIGTIFKMAKVEHENSTVFLTIQNEAQKEQIQGVRQEFIDQLRSELQNSQVGLEIRISAAEPLTRAFKPLDIFKAMTERNPALMDLKKRFDLEIDY